MEYIRIRGARTHNLKNINLDLPRHRLMVATDLVRFLPEAFSRARMTTGAEVRIHA